MAEIFANNVSGRLSEVIAEGDTTISLEPGHSFMDPGANWYRATLYRTEYTPEGIHELDHEVVIVTALSGDVLTVTRGQEGTVAQAFEAGTSIELRLTAGAVNGTMDRSNHTGTQDVSTIDGLSGVLKTIKPPLFASFTVDYARPTPADPDWVVHSSNLTIALSSFSYDHFIGKLAASSLRDLYATTSSGLAIRPYTRWDGHYFKNYFPEKSASRIICGVSNDGRTMVLISTSYVAANSYELLIIGGTFNDHGDFSVACFDTLPVTDALNNDQDYVEVSDDGEMVVISFYSAEKLYAGSLRNIKGIAEVTAVGRDFKTPSTVRFNGRVLSSSYSSDYVVLTQNGIEVRSLGSQGHVVGLSDTDPYTIYGFADGGYDIYRVTLSEATGNKVNETLVYSPRYLYSKAAFTVVVELPNVGLLVSLRESSTIRRSYLAEPGVVSNGRLVSTSIVLSRGDRLIGDEAGMFIIHNNSGNRFVGLVVVDDGDGGIFCHQGIMEPNRAFNQYLTRTGFVISRHATNNYVELMVMQHTLNMPTGNYLTRVK